MNGIGDVVEVGELGLLIYARRGVFVYMLHLCFVNIFVDFFEKNRDLNRVYHTLKYPPF